MKKDFYIMLLLLLLGGLMTWYFFFKEEIIPEPIVYHHYITDTVKVQEDYVPPLSDGIKTEPKVIKEYYPDTKAIDSLNLVIRDQNIVITQLSDSISLHYSYITQFPNNPKLLSLSLEKDSMLLGLLKTNGLIEERSWPLNLNRFNYKWDNVSNLTRHPTPLPPAEDQLFAQYFVGGGVDVLRASPYVSGSIEKSISNFRFYGNLQVGLLNKETSMIRLGVDYKINGAKN